jgi:hypothetical protein
VGDIQFNRNAKRVGRQAAFWQKRRIFAEKFGELPHKPLDRLCWFWYTPYVKQKTFTNIGGQSGGKGF